MTAMNDNNTSRPELWVCGDTLVELYSGDSAATSAQPIWSWDSRTAAGVSDDRRARLRVMDEVKPVDLAGQRCVLMTSSGAGGCALIRRSDQAVLFTAGALAAHSAELLPGGWIVVAAANPLNELQLYHVSDGHPEAPRTRTAFPSAHGAVYDSASGLLWTCGADQVVAYRLDGLMHERNPAWEIVHEIRLPERWAHDLSADPLHGGLIVTTQHNVWRLDAGSRAIAPFEPLAGLVAVKAVSVERRTGRIAFQKGEAGRWWSDTIYLLGPGQKLGMILLPERRLYKVRWDQ